MEIASFCQVFRSPYQQVRAKNKKISKFSLINQILTLVEVGKSSVFKTFLSDLSLEFSVFFTFGEPRVRTFLFGLWLFSFTFWLGFHWRFPRTNKLGLFGSEFASDFCFFPELEILKILLRSDFKLAVSISESVNPWNDSVSSSEEFLLSLFFLLLTLLNLVWKTFLIFSTVGLLGGMLLETAFLS